MKQKRPYPHFKFPNEINITYAKMQNNACGWHNVQIGSYEIRCTNYGWFPTNVLMGVIEGKFADTKKIGANIGGNMGTAGMAVINIDAAIKLLTDAGYNSIKEATPIFS